MKSKRKFTSEFKAKVALEAIKERQTLAELAVKYELHPNQITDWKRQFLEKSSLIFTEKHLENKDKEVIQNLYEQIGRLQVENNFLKKKLY